MITLKIDRRAFYALVAVIVMVVPLALGALLGRRASRSPSAKAPVADSSISTAPTVPVSALGLSGPVQIQSGTAQPVATPDATAAAVPRISVEDAAQLYGQPDVLFIDARDLSQYQLGHIRGAISVPLTEVMSHLAELPKDKQIIVYCA